MGIVRKVKGYLHKQVFPKQSFFEHIFIHFGLNGYHYHVYCSLLAFLYVTEQRYCQSQWLERL